MNNQNKTALVLGASGLVGSELIETLLQQNIYQKIIVMVRRPINLPANSQLELQVIDFDKMDLYQELFQVNDVYCCLGTTMKKAKSKQAFRKVDYDYPLEAARIAREKSVEKYLIVTAMGADSKSVFFYNQVKGELEEALKSLELNSLHIFRPSLLLGKRDEFRLGEKIGEKASFLLNFLMVGPLRPFRGIQAKKVAAAMAFVGQSKKTGVHTYLSHQIEQMIGLS